MIRGDMEVESVLGRPRVVVVTRSSDYQQLQESKSGLKRLFRVTLTLIFFLTAFAAIAAAFLLSGCHQLRNRQSGYGVENAGLRRAAKGRRRRGQDVFVSQTLQKLR